MVFRTVHSAASTDVDFVPLWTREQDGARRDRPPVDAGTPARAEERPREIDGEALRWEYDKGVSEGQEQALDRMNRRLEQQIAVWSEIFEVMSVHVDDRLRQFSEELGERTLAMAIAISERIIRGELTTDKTVLQRIIGDALTRLGDESHVRIRVNPGDKTMIDGWLGERDAAARPRVDVEADSAIERGDFVVDMGSKTLDYRVWSQLERIEADLTNFYQQQRHG